MKTIAERIIGLREEAGLTQEALAELVGVHRSQISRWERGEGGIDDQKLARLADAFSKVLKRRLTTDFILGREEQTSVPTKGTQDEVTALRAYPMGMTRRIPVFQSIPIGAEPQLIDQEDVPMSELQDTKGPCYFLQVSDDSMSGAGVHKGHRALIDTGAEVQDGDIALIAVEGDTEARLRQFYREGDRHLVLADNSGGRPMLVDAAKVQILGKMVWGEILPQSTYQVRDNLWLQGTLRNAAKTAGQSSLITA